MIKNGEHKLYDSGKVLSDSIENLYEGFVGFTENKLVEYFYYSWLVPEPKYVKGGLIDDVCVSKSYTPFGVSNKAGAISFLFRSWRYISGFKRRDLHKFYA